MENLERVLQLNIGVAQEDNGRMFDLLSEIFPLDILSIPSGTEYNGWIVPDDWQVKRASISGSMRQFFDGTEHPLAVAQYSDSFHGTVNYRELYEHVFTRPDVPSAYPYHSQWLYRPWESNWGFCVPYNQYTAWPDCDYHIDLETVKTPGHMKIGYSHIEGYYPETIVFAAHTCHACQANDGLAAVFVLLELFKWITQRQRKYSYLLLLGPEHYGTIFYLKQQRDLSIYRGGVFLDMPGSDGPLYLQRSFEQNTAIDDIAEYTMRQVQPDLQIGPYAETFGNDETVWENMAEMPMVAVSRWPYREYHTSADNLDIIIDAKMSETLEALKKMVLLIEKNFRFDSGPTYLSLSNPNYNLYRHHPVPGVVRPLCRSERNMARMQGSLFRWFNSDKTLLDMARRWDIPFTTLHEYIKHFQDKSLLKVKENWL